MKLNYFEVGHTHCDGDGEIGDGGTAISNIPLQTFEHFREAMIKCFQDRHQSFVDVQRYGEML